VKLNRSRIRVLLGIVGFAFIAMSGGKAYAQAESPTNSLPNPYHLVEGWGKNLPGGRQWGSTNAVYVDSKDNVWVADRCGGSSCADSALDPIIELDPSGKELKSFGAGMFVTPHGINIDKSGDIWVTDFAAKGDKGKQVIKFSPDGKELMRLGKAGVTGDGPDTFSQPDCVVVAPNGDIFVADGHTPGKGTMRIMKFTKDGKFIKQWGELGSGPGQFNVPHALAFDSKGRLFVGDRANKRIQIFNQDGKFLGEWKQFGQPSGIYIDRHDELYVTDSQSQSTDPKNVTYNEGFDQGIRIGSAKDGKVTAFIPIPHPPDVSTNAPEGIVADSKANIYIADVVLKDVRKYVKK
jgi:secreted PhoX family phosphatase